MGFEIGFPELVLILTIVAMILGENRLKAMRDDPRWSRLQNELRKHMLVYSAETTSGKEAEFIRDRLPKRFQTVIVLVVIVVLGAVVWWLTR